ncbi:uncharacterized, partial [Tachysurus ichikawai]
SSGYSRRSDIVAGHAPFFSFHTVADGIERRLTEPCVSVD